MVTFERSAVLCYRIYDIANEIDLRAVERLTAQDARRLQLTRENSQYLLLPNPPVTVALGSHPLRLGAETVEVEAKGRVFEFGAGSIILTIPVPPGTPLETLIPIADELYDSPPVEELALKLINGLRKNIEPACEAPHLWEQNESYTVIFAERLGGGVPTAQLAMLPEVARLLVGERDPFPLSEREREAITSHRFSYKEDDLAIVDWNSAFVVEPSGSPDIPNLLEICNAQLLEFRYYDAMLDQLLLGTSEELQRQRGRMITRVVRSPYLAMTRRLLTTLVELSEFTERAENSLKIIGDFYLAKLYEAAVRRLRIPTWQATVTRKQQLLTQTYQLLKGQVDTTRALTLEASIVMLIVLEIFLAFWRH